ncbi:MAG: response regulator [Synergistaceae bacterium]|nr:response regulator [Synergistaceae bacterium]
MDWILIVDDDVVNLKMAGTILSRQGMRVTALKSGQALLDFLPRLESENKEFPDLCLLDIKMPLMNGFETLKKLRAYEKRQSSSELPVIFLTADESGETETMALSLGAMDFIKKPFIPEVLMLRVRHTIDLVRLQKNLENEVAKKTEENYKLFIHVVWALAAAIDAKDIYTNGHSARVAKYAKEIARRYGYNEKQQNDIYVMGLLHDVGKIGVPDAIIKKSDGLTDEEYELIKKHPVIGARILESIKEMPTLAYGARWHHEKYSGGGYPDGLIGGEIPEQARLIAVADAYDAMASRRSYRDVLPQDVVRKEIEKGKGTQFDPVFADIMLEMIDEDKEYKMKESN